MNAVPIYAAEVRDVLAMVPHQLGYVPEESLVLIAVTGDGRIGPMARIDLADAHDKAGKAVELLLREAPAEIYGVAYSEAKPDEDDTIHASLQEAWAAVDSEMPEGIDGGFAAQVTPEEFWLVLGSDVAHDRRPLSDMQSSVLAAHLVASGSSYVASGA